ncbi:hypothetical protein [Vibrio mediterranei]|uniref:hypothetical protein n=1 Tax=Vibrio mediterranei TaxID=689 RepID=UPI004068009F
MYILNLTSHDALEGQQLIEFADKALKDKVGSLLSFDSPPRRSSLVGRAGILAKMAFEEIARHKCAEAIDMVEGRHETMICDDFEDALASLRRDEWRVLIDGPSYIIGQLEVELRKLNLQAVHAFHQLGTDGEKKHLELVEI